MVRLVVGDKGKGKTKYLLDMANEAVRSAEGSIVYLDKSTKHMYELNNKIRLINVKDFPIKGSDGFLGFVAGIISQDHDLESLYLDSYLKLADLEDASIENPVNELAALADKYSVDMVLSISMDESKIPEAIKQYIVVSL